MLQMIFVNIPVKDVAASVVVSETISFMILNHDRFQGFATKPLADPVTSTSVMIALSHDSRAAVDALTEAALMAGGTEPKPANDMGFMYGRTCHDIDGNVFEPF